MLGRGAVLAGPQGAPGAGLLGRELLLAAQEDRATHFTSTPRLELPRPNPLASAVLLFGEKPSHAAGARAGAYFSFFGLRAEKTRLADTGA